jgi:alpha-L-rhamnosidase
MTTTNETLYDLRCDFRSQLVGAPCDGAGFSWKIRPGGVLRGSYQAAYQLELSPVGGKCVWDTGKVLSSRQTQVVCPVPLAAHTKYEWRVRIWDDAGADSGWSEKQHFITGLRAEDWLGGWLTYDGIDSIYPFRDHVWIRGEFTLPDAPAEAFLYAATLGFHDLYVNGEKADDRLFAPGRSCTRDGSVHANYAAYDLSGKLNTGKNVIGLAMDAGFSRMNINLTPCLRVQLYAGGFELHADTGWRCMANGNRYSGAYRWGDFGGEETAVPPSEAFWSAAGYCADGWAPLKPAAPDCLLREAAVEPDRIVGELRPAAVCVRDGKTVVDMGRNYTGLFALRLPKLEREVAVSVSDKKDARCAFHQKIVYAPGLGHGAWYQSQFNYVSGRYFTIAGLPGELKAEDVRGYAVSNDLTRTGSFSCSDELLNRIYEQDLATFRDCTVGGVTMDCPHRERLAYGDSATGTFRADALLNYRAGAFCRNVLTLWEDSQRADGYFAHTAADFYGGGGTLWSSFPVLGCMEYYRFTGDLDFLRERYPALKKWEAYLRRYTKNGLLQRYEYGPWDFLGDWATPDGDDWGSSDSALYFNNCCYALVLKNMREAAQRLGETEDARLFARLHSRLAGGIRAKYRQDNGIYCRADARYQAIALEAGIVLRIERDAVYENLLRITREKGYLDGGSAGLKFLFHQLGKTDAGNELIFRWLQSRSVPGYGAFVQAGETAWPETWQMRSVYGASRIHTCYTGCAGWFLENLCGICADENKITISPFFPAGLQFAQGGLESVCGQVCVRWERRGEEIELTAEIPFAADAVFLCAGQKKKLRVGAQRLILTRERKIVEYSTDS